MSSKKSRQRRVTGHNIDFDDLFIDEDDEFFDYSTFKDFVDNISIRSMSLDTTRRLSNTTKAIYKDIKNIGEIIDMLASLYSDTLLDIQNDRINNEKENIKNELYDWLIDQNAFKNIDDFNIYMDSYFHLMKVLENNSAYLKKYSFEEALTLINEVDKDIDNDEQDNNYNEILKNVTYFVIANYYNDNKLNKDNFFYPDDEPTKNEYVDQINALIAGIENHDTTQLRSMLNYYIHKSNVTLKEQLSKKAQRILQNTLRKADKNKNDEKQLYITKDSATNKLNKLALPYSNDEAKYDIAIEIIDKVLMKLNEYIDNYINQIKETKVNEERKKLEKLIKDKEDKDQENSQNTLNIGNTETNKDSNHNDSNIKVTTQESQNKKINNKNINDTKENIKSYEKTQSKEYKNISDTDSKIDKPNEVKTFSTFTKTSYDSLYNTTMDNFNKSYSNAKIIKIGSFDLIKESERDNPINYEAIAMKLHKDDIKNLDRVEALIDQYGLDRINTYLTRTQSNSLHIDHLERYLQLDRSLRYEYQKLMEDIEMYFSSTFCSYLTNKYDKKYKIRGSNDIYEYRGYLSKTLFVDSNEHFSAIKQLRDRIDVELNLNNEQILDEFSKHKYSISFASALGIMTFGWSVNMFNNLNSQDKAEYLSIYYKNLTSYTFNNWINNLLSFRNRLAHYKELYKISSYDMLKSIATTYSDGNSYDDEFGHSTLFYYTIIIARLSPDVENIEDFIDNVGILFRKAERKNECFNLLDDYSFPKTWKLILENEKSTKVNVIQ